MEDLFKDRFDDWESQPPQDGWDKIASELDNDRRSPLFYWTMAVGILLIASVGSLWTLHDYTTPLVNSSILPIFPFHTAPNSIEASSVTSNSNTSYHPQLSQPLSDASNHKNPSAKSKSTANVNIPPHKNEHTLNNLSNPSTTKAITTAKTTKLFSHAKATPYPIPLLANSKLEGTIISLNFPYYIHQQHKKPWRIGALVSMASLQGSTILEPEQGWIIQQQQQFKVPSVQVWELGLNTKKQFHKNWQIEASIRYTWGVYKNTWEARSKYASEVVVTRHNPHSMTMQPVAFHEKDLQASHTWQRLGGHIGLNYRLWKNQSIHTNIGIGRIWTNSQEVNINSPWSIPFTIGYQWELGQFTAMPFIRHESLQWQHHSQWIKQSPFSIGIQLASFF